MQTQVEPEFVILVALRGRQRLEPVPVYSVVLVSYLIRFFFWLTQGIVKKKNGSQRDPPDADLQPAPEQQEVDYGGLRHTVSAHEKNPAR